METQNKDFGTYLQTDLTGSFVLPGAQTNKNTKNTITLTYTHRDQSKVHQYATYFPMRFPFSQINNKHQNFT